MKQDQIFNLLWKGLLLTFPFSSLLTLIIVQIAFGKMSQSFEGGQGVVLLSIGGVLWCLALTISAATVFFNLYPAIRDNIYYCFLSYFIVPFFIALYIGLNANASDMAKYFFALTVPFFVVQTWFFIKFITQKKCFDQNHKGLN
ncbi:hypothetical protein DIU36_20180 [Mucilaginibacter rubeus]|nr:hypothetical protein DIU36_20180 [Mucilaginibacter rubeus]